ncbi:Phospholipid-transporting ATPase DNF2, partial [Gryllus bimaculatus]
RVESPASGSPALRVCHSPVVVSGGNGICVERVGSQSQVSVKKLRCTKMPTVGSGELEKSPQEENQQCSTYLFPSTQASVAASSGELSGATKVPPVPASTVASIPASIMKGHTRSASHGGVGTSVSSSNVVGRPSALKQNRGHQRAFSQGQIEDGAGATSFQRGHSRVGSKTDFILPPGHRDSENNVGAPPSATKVHGHSRQASRSESIYTLRQSGTPSLWHQFQTYVLRRKGKTEVEEPRYRTVVPNHLVPPRTPQKAHPNGKRPDNRIRTTKYTLLSFLPKNLLEQFHRVANLYFIFIVLLNWFPAINAFGKEIAMIPVLFVLGVTAIKDLFEDRRRHASDKRINNSTCRVYSGCKEVNKKIQINVDYQLATIFLPSTFVSRNNIGLRIFELVFVKELHACNESKPPNTKAYSSFSIFKCICSTSLKHLIVHLERAKGHLENRGRKESEEAERYQRVLWKDVRVGDVVHLSNNELVPADVLLLRSSDPHGLCYLDTCNLDGETSLKQRCVARGFVEKQEVFHPSRFRSVVEVDTPTTKIYRFHGALVHPAGRRVPVGTENLLLREL